MQVRKFEAKTMKDALELVKQHLGPEAIILSAKDNSRGFGLMGEKSVEVTAAISEETLRKKKLAEMKLREDQKNRFYQAPARQQREFIQRVFEKPQSQASAPVRRPPTNTPYIDIFDEEATPAQQAPAPQPVTYRPPVPQVARPAANPSPASHTHVKELESQIVELKSIIEKFNKMPQTLSSHPGAEEGIPFQLTGAFQKLTQAGMATPLVVDILKKAQKHMPKEEIKRPAMVDAWIVQYLLKTVEITKDPSAGRYHVFMGTTGQGKTTSLVKFASWLLMKQRKRIAIVCLDTVKVGAKDQLKIYAQILNVPFAVVRNSQDWSVLERKLQNVQHILVDCPGLNLRSMKEMEWLKSLLPPISLDRTVHYVQSVLARDEEAFDLAARYRMIGFNDLIFTRLDESARHGNVINFQEKFNTPLHSFGIGTQIPEDFELASKERVIDLLFKISKVNKSKREHEVEHGY